MLFAGFYFLIVLVLGAIGFALGYILWGLMRGEDLPERISELRRALFQDNPLAQQVQTGLEQNRELILARTGDIMALRSDAESRGRELVALERRSAEAETSLAVYEGELGELRSSLREKDELSFEMRHKLDTCEAAVDHRSGEIEPLRRLLAERDLQIVDLERRLAGAEQSATGRGEQRRLSEKEGAPLEKQIQETTEELAGVRRRQDEMRKTLTELRESLDGLRESEEAAGKNMTVAARQRDLAGQKASELRRELAQAEQKKKELDARLESAQGEMGSLGKKNEEVQAQMATLSQKTEATMAKRSETMSVLAREKTMGPGSMSGSLARKKKMDSGASMLGSQMGSLMKTRARKAAEKGELGSLLEQENEWLERQERLLEVRAQEAVTLAEQVRGLRSTVAESAERERRVEAEVAETEERIHRVRGELNSLRDEVARAQKTLQRLRDEAGPAEGQIAELEMQAQELDDALARGEGISGLRAEAASVQRELETLVSRLAERNKRIHLLRVQMDEARTATERIRSNTETLESQAATVSAEDADAARWLDENARALEAANAEVGELEERIGKRQAEVEATRERLRGLDATLASHAAEEGRLANAVRELQVDLDMER